MVPAPITASIALAAIGRIASRLAKTTENRLWSGLEGNLSRRRRGALIRVNFADRARPEASAVLRCEKFTQSQNHLVTVERESFSAAIRGNGRLRIARMETPGHCEASITVSTSPQQG
jgi:hypothetical protein